MPWLIGFGLVLLLACDRVRTWAIASPELSANGTAAIAYIFFAPVDWSAALATGAGAVLGGLVGPAIVRVAPEKPLRWRVAAAGLRLALWLATG